jgi:hypothetical protein
VIVRGSHRLPEEIIKHPNITVLDASILDLVEEKLVDIVNGCDAVISCLGHTTNFKGIFGEPKKLCTDATRYLCNAIETNGPTSPTKFILMSTVGVPNPDNREQRTWIERGLLTLLSWLIPPHKDNETALEYLHTTVGKENKYLEWCIVRPDSLIDADVSQYDTTESPTTGIFSGRPTTRSNVAHFMTKLSEDNALWSKWKFKMPVIMNTK